MLRIKERWGAAIDAACQYSSLPPAFLAALIANESGGDPAVQRFERPVYQELLAVKRGPAPVSRRGQGPAPSGTGRGDGPPPEGSADLGGAQKGFGPQGGTSPLEYAGLTREYLEGLDDQGLRDLATSWGLTQVMGYHVARRPGGIALLCNPTSHLKIALELLSEFAERFGLDLRLEFRELFHCWNSGRPYGKTFDPEYAEKGISRLQIYKELTAEARLPDGQAQSTQRTA